MKMKTENALKHAFKRGEEGFPGGPVAKNPPCRARNTGSIPGPGRSHMLLDNSAQVPHY